MKKNTSKKIIPTTSKCLRRQELEKKVIEGTDRAVRQYKEVLHRLAAYDKR